MKKLGLVAFAGFIGVIVAANWAVNKYGIVPIGFGLAAPAGVFFVGISFTLRDILSRTLGRLAVIAAILVGAGVSYWISNAIALPGGKVSLAVASGLAFLFSESADMAVYEPLSRKTFLVGVAASNVVGAVVDSCLFLWLAFGSLTFVDGQIVGKLYMTLAALPLVFAARKKLAHA